MSNVLFTGSQEVQLFRKYEQLEKDGDLKTNVIKRLQRESLVIDLQRDGKRFKEFFM